MTADLTPLTIDLFQSGKALDPQLLMAARLHVGAAGIGQTAALERLIAAGQEHTGLAQAVRQVTRLLEQAGDSAGQRQLLHDSQHLSLVLTELATVVTGALEQITATPVQRISVERLTEIADQMQRHLSALEELIYAAEASPAVPDASTPDLEAVLARLRERVAQIRAEQRLGQLQTLAALISQVVAEIAAAPLVSSAERLALLKGAQSEIRQAAETVGAQS
jgi:hypothetical protein